MGESPFKNGVLNGRIPSRVKGVNDNADYINTNDGLDFFIRNQLSTVGLNQVMNMTDTTPFEIVLKTMFETMEQDFPKIVCKNDVHVDIKSWRDESGDTKNNDLIINAVFDSLLLHVINYIDKYWAMKYNGTLDLPMSVHKLMKGGSVFDTKGFKDVSYAKIIPEAVPLYIAGLNACQYYIEKLSKSTNNNAIDELHQEMEISELSPLYPIYEIFKKYNAKIESMSLNQLAVCINVFNDIWNQTNDLSFLINLDSKNS